MTQVDGQILLWIQEHIRNDILTTVFRFITKLGDGGLVWILIAVLCILFRQHRKAGMLSIISLFCSILINNLLLKNLLGRVRPYEVVEGLQHLIPAPVDYSFPSGHAGSSFAVAVILLIYLPKRYGIPAIILAGLIACSRLYLGVHYVLDVLSGSVIGAGIALAIWRLEKLLHPNLE